MKAIFDAVNVKEATEKAIAQYTDMCVADINRIHTEESKKASVIALVQKLQNRSK